MMVVVNVKQEPGLPKQPIVQLGKLGEIKRLMRSLSKRESYVDLDLVCHDGTLGCHKFIIGAQSKYLRKLMLNANPDGERCQIHFPDVKKVHMEVVLKFLYTGKLGITDGIKNIVRELLEDILHIDAKVSLPETIALPDNPKSKRKDDDKGPGGSPGSGGSKGPQDPPSPKRRRPEEEADENNGSNGNQDQGKMHDAADPTKAEVRRSCSIIDDSAPPPTPPQEVELCQEEDDDIQVLPTPSKPAPLFIDLDDEDSVATAGPFGDKVICQAPGIITKRTGAPIMGNHDRTITPAPRCVAKSTGYHPPVKPSIDVSSIFEKAMAGNSHVPFMMPIQNSKFTVKKRVESPTHEPISQLKNLYSSPVLPPHNPPTTPYVSSGFKMPPLRPPGFADIPPPEPTDRKTRTSTGAITRFSLNEESLGGYDEEERRKEDKDEDYMPIGFPTRSGTDVANAEPFTLPPPLPLAPSEGVVIRRGKWVRESSAPAASKKSVGTSKVHKYHFSPYTISGKTKDQTFATLQEPEGYHACDQCPNVYNKLASLLKHKGRIHNPNLNVQCPECPRKLSHRSALAKHLLSHRPEDQWPYICEFCGKYFQAKADLPKHWFTAKHKEDRKNGIIPAPGSELWYVVLHRSARFSLKDMMRKSGITPANESPLIPKEEEDEDDDLTYKPNDSIHQVPEPSLDKGNGGTSSDSSNGKLNKLQDSSQLPLPPPPQLPLPSPNQLPEPHPGLMGGPNTSAIFSNFGISDILTTYSNDAPLTDLAASLPGPRPNDF